MNIISHRGFWLEEKQKNTIEAFRLALDCGFGIETDVRDYDGELVISHDIPNKNCLSFKDFMNIVSEYPNQTLALNIKSDGLQALVKKDLKQYPDYFCFDMSVPDTLGYERSKLTFYTRFSDIEQHPSLLSESSGIWLDNFTSNNLDLNSLDTFLAQDKQIVLVSPELHGYEYKEYWEDLLKYINNNLHTADSIGLCTDKPSEAKEFFINVK